MNELFAALGFKAFSLSALGATVEIHVRCDGVKVYNFFGIAPLVRMEEEPPPQPTCTNGELFKTSFIDIICYC